MLGNYCYRWNTYCEVCLYIFPCAGHTGESAEMVEPRCCLSHWVHMGNMWL